MSEKLYAQQAVHRVSKRSSAGLVISLFGFSVTVNVLPPLVTQFARIYSVDPGFFGIAFSLQYLFYALASYGIGFCASRGFSRLEPLIVGALMISAAGLAFLGHVPSFIILTVLLAIVGMCGGIIEANSTSLLADGGPEGGDMLHLSQFFYCAGAFTAPMVIGMLLSRDISLPVIGYLVGGITLVTAVVVSALLSPGSREPGRSSNEEAREEAAGKADRRFIWFLLVMFLYVVVEISLVSWLPYYMEGRFHVRASSAALSSAAFFIGLGASRFIYVFIPVKRMFLHLAVCASGMLLALAFLHIGVGAYRLLLAWVVLLGCACGPVWPLIISLCDRSYRRKHLTMYLVSAGSIGALIGPGLTSLLFSTSGLHAMLMIVIGYALLFAAALSALRVSTSAG